MLGGGDDRRLRSVRDHDPPFRGGREVDVVHPHPRPADDLQAVGALDQVCRELGPASDDDGVVLADRRGQVAVRLDVDLEAFAEQVDPGLRDRLSYENPHAATGLGVRLERGRDRRPALDVRAGLDKGALEGREGRGDVLHVDVADVAEANDLPALLALAPDDGDARALAHGGDDRLPVDLCRHADRSDHGRAVGVRREELEPHCLHACASCAPEAKVALVGGVETVGQDQIQGHVEPPDERDRRRERGLAHRLGGDGPLPVHVVARKRSGLRRLEGRRGNRRERQPRRAHERLVRAGQHDVEAPVVGLERDRGEAGDRVHCDQRSGARQALGGGLQVGDSSRGGVRVGQVHDAGTADLVEAGAHLVGARQLAPLVAQVVDGQAVAFRDRGPPLPEVAVRDDEHAVAGRADVGDRGLHRRGPGRGEEEHVILRPVHGLEPLDHARERVTEVGRAMVDHRLGRRREHLRRHRGGPRRDEVALLRHTP